MMKNRWIRNTILVGLSVCIVGFVVMLIGFGQGGRLTVSNYRIGPIGMVGINRQSDEKTTTFHLTPENITGLDIEAEVGDVEIVKGDHFEVNMEGFKPSEVKYSNLSHGIFKIETYSGIDLISLGTNNNYGKIKVIVPASFDKVEVSANVGDVRVSDLTLKEFDISVDVGNLEAKNMNVDVVEMDVNLGHALYHGAINQSVEADCDLGELELQIKGVREEYSMELDADLGDVTVDGQHHGTYESKGTTNKKIEASTNLGELIISFIQ
ncbi:MULTISPECIES: DUF4097 family beta strand repeat-containing protein [unclassified Breznakia]|uniref:DUF4097 family beta strand repeat-containing protein n=1 Tax=unclassified Breznakia TaxID=2623764 RepID=UPI0024763909|nr:MULTISPECIES: DUF4097 family beta strand repeat-containing protein [unclassified Breznakia]MDH6366189.1 hypothetical protein [Breznakia sp. PH1-1]MDH6403282.1 hypothetical protein [Breznakia sp. PF1-11]MDH6410991.1 hypothetical protein [Breznakia sp. PFB1-11]MDH6413355.1 hypothetical protein [Breznakia sp. PFB1-14]MDH6416120.1 hypothetical protein [Breznakia sp. PFB1-4]